MAALQLTTRRARLRVPLVTAWGTLHVRELVRVLLVFGDRDWGEGEAAPLEPYDGVPLGAVLSALDVYATILRDFGPGDPHDAMLAACREERPLPQALAAIDLALWDRAGRREGKPVAALLGADDAASVPVPVNATIGAEDRAGAAAAAAEAVAEGFTCLKLKVGVGDDAGRLAAVRAAVGRDVAIRVDANGAWETPREALANLRVLAPLGVELCEEPIHGAEALREVSAESPVPVAADETATEPGTTPFVCLKISRCGGITPLLREAGATRAAGAQVYLASTYDGPPGIAAALHAAAALAPLPHCGLATLESFRRFAPGPLTARAGAIAVPTGPGLLG